MLETTAADRFGLGWRAPLAAGILVNLDRIDVLEVLADDYVHASRRERRALRTLARQVPVTLHGTSLGLASTETVTARRLERLARLVGEIEPVAWSEHLAFVRGGELEIGHLAAPARCAETVDGLVANVRRAREIVGSAPLLENVATLVDPPRSVLGEDEWVSRCIEGSGAPLLLDLHNLHANATNFGFDAVSHLRRIPLHRVAQVHLAGGRWVERHGARRILDDHLHDVPDPVFALLAEVARLAPQPLVVILERDGNFETIEDLLAELDRARAVVAGARREPRHGLDAPVGEAAANPSRREPNLAPVTPPSTPRRWRWPRWGERRGAEAHVTPTIEATMARVFVDEAARVRFAAAEPTLDRSGLALAAESYARKRAAKARGHDPTPRR
ncbi:MAG: DUF692 domain-containing protein [bacterium]